MIEKERQIIIAKANELVTYFNHNVLENMPESFIRQWRSFIENGYIVVIGSQAYVQEHNIK